MLFILLLIYDVNKSASKDEDLLGNDLTKTVAADVTVDSDHSKPKSKKNK